MHVRGGSQVFLIIRTMGVERVVLIAFRRRLLYGGGGGEGGRPA